MLKIWLLSWMIFGQICGQICAYTIYERKSRPELFQSNVELNPQGWASHNTRDIVPGISKKVEQLDLGIAMLPSLLMLNPRARGVFENLKFFANPQFLPEKMKKQHEFNGQPVDFDQIRTIRRKPIITRPKKREIMEKQDDMPIGLIRILRQAVMDFQKRTMKI